MASRSVQTVRRLAWLLDDLVRIPGTRIRIGLDPVLGLLPGGGDVAAGLIGVYTLLAASRAGAPPSVILRMAGNIVVDLLVGAIPLLGDLFDFGFKANRRNVDLLERYVAAPEPVQQRSRVIVAIVVIGVVVLLAGVATLSVQVLRWLTDRG